MVHVSDFFIEKYPVNGRGDVLISRDSVIFIKKNRI